MVHKSTKSEPNLDDLPLKERIVVTTTSRLVRHVRGLESSGLIQTEYASSLMGAINRLASLARGEEPVATKE